MWLRIFVIKHNSVAIDVCRAFPDERCVKIAQLSRTLSRMKEHYILWNSRHWQLSLPFMKVPSLKSFEVDVHVEARPFALNIVVNDTNGWTWGVHYHHRVYQILCSSWLYHIFMSRSAQQQHGLYYCFLYGKRGEVKEWSWRLRCWSWAYESSRWRM